MDSLRLEGTTIRGVVQGRKINCTIASAPAGLALPSGQYWLSAAETSPVFGQLLSIEAAREPRVTPGTVGHKIEPATARADSPAIATLVPAAEASGIKAGGDFHIKFAPGALKDAPAGKFFDSANPSGSPRVIIAVRPIGENSLVAQAGFSDLAETVQRAGGVTLVVA
jgi:hypothetical protein